MAGSVSLNATALRLMREKGLSLEDVVEIASAMEVRSAGAERQRRYRERQGQGASDVTGDVTGDVTNSDVTQPLTPPLSPPNPQTLPPEPAHKQTLPARKADPFLCPEGVEAEHWRDFLANRKRKGLTNTATAYGGQLRAIAQLADDEWPPGRLVQFAAEKGWGSINDPRESDHRNGIQRPRREARPDPIAEAWRSAVAEERAERDQADNPGTWPALPASFPGSA